MPVPAIMVEIASVCVQPLQPSLMNVPSRACPLIGEVLHFVVSCHDLDSDDQNVSSALRSPFTNLVI